jgi:parallel beta-helix repeat protein
VDSRECCWGFCSGVRNYPGYYGILKDNNIYDVYYYAIYTPAKAWNSQDGYWHVIDCNYIVGNNVLTSSQGTSVITNPRSEPYSYAGVWYPPDAPVKPEGETLGFIDTTYTYSTSATHPKNSPVRYTVDWGDNLPLPYAAWYASGEPATFSHSWSACGEYKVRMKAIDIYDVESRLSEPLTVTILVGYPTAVIAVDRLVAYTYEPFTFNGTASYSPNPDGYIVNYTWSFGDGTFGYGAIVMHEFKNDGSYEVYLTVTDNYGLQGMNKTAVIVLNRPPVAAAGADIVAEVGEKVVLYGSESYDRDGKIVNYKWVIMPMENVYYGCTVTCFFKAKGYYFVNLTVTDDDGATSFDWVKITVWNPELPTISGNKISKCGYGVYIKGTDINVIEGTFYENDYGFYFDNLQALSKTVLFGAMSIQLKSQQGHNQF